jgi:hypothetical protein
MSLLQDDQTPMSSRLTKMLLCLRDNIDSNKNVDPILVSKEHCCDLKSSHLKTTGKNDNQINFSLILNLYPFFCRVTLLQVPTDMEI